jgi:hypothetical protein
MQRQCWHKEEKDNHYPDIRKEVQGECSQFLFIHFKLFHEPRRVGVPQSQSGNPIEHSEEDTNHKGAEEKVSKENDLFAFHYSSFILDGGIGALLSDRRNLREFARSMDQLTACESAK